MISTFDSNILVYSSDPAAGDRHRRAFDLVARGMRSGRSILLLQTLAEFSFVATRKLRIPVPEIRDITDGWGAVFAVHPQAEADLPAALDAVDKHNLALWDAMIWAAASRLGVRYVLSEDFQDGRMLGGVHFIDPFVTANDALIDDVLPR